MKCPKCTYIGFEDTDRCRHCGYEFSLLAGATGTAGAAAMLDEVPSLRVFTEDVHEDRRVGAGGPGDVKLAVEPEGDGPQDLPLGPAVFPMLVHDAPPPARAPLAVRRADRPRGRTTTRVFRRVSSPLLETEPDASSTPDVDAPVVVAAPAGLRLAAAGIDVLLLSGIDLAVVYLTAQLAGVPLAEVVTLPLVPLGVFLLGLNVAYLTVFTANGGQTLGKMATGLRVVGVTDGLSAGGAVLRVGVALVGALLAGAGFLPALARADGRALHDYAARTRVVRVTA